MSSDRFISNICIWKSTASPIDISITEQEIIMGRVTGAIILSLLIFSPLVGCKTESEKEPEAGSIEAQMREVGHEAAKEIKSSLEKAENAGQLQTEHYKQLKDEMESQ